MSARAWLVVVVAAAACTPFRGVDDTSAHEDAQAPVAADASTAQSPCATAHTFCDDFERTTAVSAGWTDVEGAETAAVSISLAPGAGVGGSTAMHVTAQSPAPGPNAQRRLRFVVPDSPTIKGARLEYRIRAAPSDVDDWVQPISLYLGAPELHITSEMNDTSAKFTFHGATAGITFTGDLPRDWQHVVLDVDFEKDSATCTVDGRPLAPSSAPIDLSMISMALYAGLWWNTTVVRSYEAWLDDVALDVRR